MTRTTKANTTKAKRPSGLGDDHPDADLLARVAEFYPAAERHYSASEAWSTGMEKAEAMPDCPPHPVPADGRVVNERWHAFMEAQGESRLYDKMDAAGRKLGKAANAVFAIPAHTYEGAVEKVKIAYIATGDGEGTYTGDADLDAYQDFETPWMANAIADLDRLAGVS